MVGMKKKTRKRGRPRKLTERVRLQVDIEREQLEWLDRQPDNRSETIRQIIETVRELTGE